ncbi:MAG TPA: hypothetical protein DCZ69_09000 [Syntrophobacteraceae bacterium]|jgi:hypothetical protein|nr:hypothetical protein [Syntrophobacteraceae bacterium]HBD08386.1 hypothetical protein [Syntrophobacteraceae bacterium]HBZ57135.1 hypothetical protein [Syntrophobacteraceae bacterium]
MEEVLLAAWLENQAQESIEEQPLAMEIQQPLPEMMPQNIRVEILEKEILGACVEANAGRVAAYSGNNEDDDQGCRPKPVPL